jgi:hypothetical protein
MAPGFPRRVGARICRRPFAPRCEVRRRQKRRENKVWCLVSAVRFISKQQQRAKGNGTPTDAYPTVRALRARQRALRSTLVCRRSTAVLTHWLPPLRATSGQASWDVVRAFDPVRPPQPGGGDQAQLLRALPAQTCPSPVAAPHRPLVVAACMMPKAARVRDVTPARGHRTRSGLQAYLPKTSFTSEIRFAKCT